MDGRTDGRTDGQTEKEKPYKLLYFGLFQFYVFAFMGFGTFMPKYVEYQFRQKGSSSSTFAGGVGTVSKAIGLLVSIFNKIVTDGRV